MVQVRLSRVINNSLRNSRLTRDAPLLHSPGGTMTDLDVSEPRDFICYLHEGWNPRIRPAEATRPWMDATPEAFAYRCLPLNIANAHGWEILSPCSFEAIWY